MPEIKALRSQDKNIVPLSSILREPLANGIFKQPEKAGKGTKLINVFDLYGDTTINLENVERLEITDAEFENFQVLDGDVFFTRSSLKPEGVAWSSYVEQVNEDAVFECHLIRARINIHKALPGFVSNYARTWLARDYLTARASVTTMATVDQGAVADLPIILPDIKVQLRLLSELEAARTARQAKLAQADELLQGMDAFVLAQLGLELPKEEKRSVFAVKSSDVKNGRADPHFHHPAFNQLMAGLQAIPHKRLTEIANFSDEVWNPATELSKTFRYIEISGIDIQTGDILATETLVNEAPSRARMMVRNGDILVSLTRPHRGAIALVGKEFDNCIASTGFSVIRHTKDRQISKEYLWCILRNQISLLQMLQRSSGGNYPAITEPELKQLLIPIPAQAVQNVIVNEFSRRQQEAQRLRTEAENDWQAAKQKFEQALLG